MKNIHHISFDLTSKEQLDELLRRIPLDTGCSGPRRAKDGTIHVDAFVSDEQLADLKRSGITVERSENITEHLVARMNEVGKGDRFEKGRITPKGLGTKY